jgi:uncharacterized protein YjdB
MNLLRSFAKLSSLALPIALISMTGCGSPATITKTTISLNSISITPLNPSIAVNATEQFTATGNYSDGSTANLSSSVTWASSNQADATMNGTGVATGMAAGSTAITASVSGVTGSTTLTVTAAAVTVTSIAVSPSSPSIATGATQQFTANATYSNGTTGALTSGVTWTSSNTTAATVSSTGLATGIAAGATTIKATADGFTATATLTVTAAAVTVTSIAVSPSSPSITAGATQQFTATATYSNGTTGALASGVTWTSSNTTAATVSSTGLATGVAAGTTTIKAAADGFTATAMLTVTAATAPTLTAIVVTPSDPTFANGSTQQFTATATYSNNTTANVTSSVTWSSSNTSVATISSGGLASGQGGGTTTISATMNSVKGSTTATVTVSGTANITTFHVDTNRSGLNDQETVLTTANVAPATFGKLFSCPIDGYVYGAPLILSNQTIDGAKHNVLYVATENDSVYAYDADTCGGGTPLWKISLLQSGETALADEAILPYVGVTSTPVIDPTSGTLYVVSTEESSSVGGTFRLSALNVDTGAQKFGGPVTINASVAATNTDSVNGVQTLDTSCLQRAALLLANGNVYIGLGGCHSGWLLAYKASTLAQVGVFNASPNLSGEGGFASAGGIWMGGAGPVADSDGNVYVTTGNGPWDGQSAWGDSVLKFGRKPVSGANGTMQPIDYFTPSIYQFMDCFDADLASGGLLLIPGSTTLIAGGKTGTMYLVDSANLGHESSNDAGALQEQVWGAGITAGGTYQQSCQDSTGTNTANIASYEIFGSTAYFNGSAYLGVTPTSASAPGGVRQFDFTSTLSAQSDTSDYQNEGTYGTSPFISANGTSDGIVWYINQGNPLQNATKATPTSASLVAYDASNYPTQLYSSTTNSGDTPGYGIKFSSPVVANGKVYVSTATDLTTVSNPQGEIDVYGLK